MHPQNLTISPIIESGASVGIPSGSSWSGTTGNNAAIQIEIMELSLASSEPVQVMFDLHIHGSLSRGSASTGAVAMGAGAQLYQDFFTVPPIFGQFFNAFASPSVQSAHGFNPTGVTPTATGFEIDDMFSFTGFMPNGETATLETYIFAEGFESGDRSVWDRTLTVTVSPGPLNPNAQIRLVPEPASLALLGLGGLMALRRRRAF